MTTTLKTIRLDRELTLKDVGDYVGRTDACVSHWESGLYRPRPAAARKLRELFGVPIDVLFTPAAEHQNGGPKTAA